MQTHQLKTWPLYFAEVAAGRKSFELRLNDRDFCEGDVVILQEWDNNKKAYTGREMKFIIGYMLPLSNFFGPENKHVVFSLVAAEHNAVF